MIKTVPLNCSLSSFVVEPKSGGSSRRASIICSGSRNNAHIPKLEPFSRNMIDRVVKEPPLIQKCENEIADYCLRLEGDDCYSCWQAYFELKELEKEAPKEEIERLIIEASGLKSLISTIHGVASIYKSKKEHHDSPKEMKLENAGHAKKEHRDSPKEMKLENAGARLCPIPDGLPKTQEEVEEEEKARMPDSPFTRLLRARGRRPDWYPLPPELA